MTKFEELRNELETRVNERFALLFGTPKKEETKEVAKHVKHVGTNVQSFRTRLETKLDKELKRHDERVEIILSFYNEATDEEVERTLNEVLAEKCFSRMELVNHTIGRGLLIASIYVD